MSMNNVLGVVYTLHLVNKQENYSREERLGHMGNLEFLHSEILLLQMPEGFNLFEKIQYWKEAGCQEGCHLLKSAESSFAK